MNGGLRSLLVSRPMRTLALGLAIAFSVIGLYQTQPMLMRQLDREVYDALLHGIEGGEPSPVPVIVDIDEASLERLGQWPWPRYQMARMLDRLTEEGAAAIGLDILLSEPDRTSPVHIRENLHRDLGIDVGFVNIPKSIEDNDQLLADALGRTPSVLGAYLRFTGELEPLPGEVKAPGVVHQSAGEEPPLHSIVAATGLSLPLPAFTRAAPVGTINAAPDTDGVIRLVPLVAQTPSGIFPALALRTLMRGLDVRHLVLRYDEYGLSTIRVGKLSVPVGPAGMFAVPFRGGRDVYPVYSAAAVLNGETPEDAFADKIVFIGSSAPGLLDIRATPLDPYYPGVGVHAAILDAVFSGRFIQAPPWTPAAQTACILLSALLCAALFGYSRPLFCIPAGFLAAAGSAGASLLLFRNGLFFSPAYVVLTIVAAALLLLSLRFWQEERQRRMVTTAFGRYVAPEVVSGILARQEDVMAGSRREVTILFTDIRRFTTLSERLEPEQVVALLNRYFTPMTAIIRANRGTLDKFIGDALMAFWNAPLDIPGHAALGVETALRLQENLIELNRELEKDFGLMLNMGAALHTGPVFVGNMGSAELLDYTIIGDSVNLASRLEGLTARYGVPTLVSASTRDACGEAFAFVQLDSIIVRGKTLPVNVFEPMRHDVHERRKGELDAFTRARTLYLQGEARVAGPLFAELARQYPTRLLYNQYVERCLAGAGNSPRRLNTKFGVVKV